MKEKKQSIPKNSFILDCKHSIGEQNELKKIDDGNENDFVLSAKSLDMKMFYHVLYYLFKLNYSCLEVFGNAKKKKKRIRCINFFKKVILMY